jgi:chitodextrinase
MDNGYCGTGKRRTFASVLVAIALLALTAVVSAQSPPTSPPFHPAGPPTRPTQPAPPDSSLATHTYAQAPAPSSYVPQPLSGIAPYFFPGTNYSSDFPSPLMWSYFGLSEVMTDPNDCTKFNWNIFDEALDEAAVYGRQMVFRFYLEYPGGTGSHPANATPQCLINQGVTMQTNPYWGSVHPVWDDPRTIQVLETFINAFAARYDTNGPNGGPDPRIAYMTAGLIGLWGEWHEWPYDGEVDSPDMMASAATVQAIVSTYNQAFHNIQVEIRYAYLAGVAADATIGLHDDSWDYREPDNNVLCGDTLPASLGGCPYSFLQYELDYGLENRWLTQSIGGEARPEIQGSIYSSWPNGSGQVDNPKASTELSHVTWLINQDGAQGGYSPTDPNIIAGVGEMGYKFYVPQANFNNSVSGNFNVGVTIENLGVAPFYYPWTVVLGLLNSSGTVVQTWNTNWDLRTVQPLSIRAFPDWNVGADPTYISYGWPMNFETSIAANGVAAGTYTLAMRVVNPLETVTQAILESRGPAEGMQAYIPQDNYTPPPPFYFWNTNFSGGWLRLGNLTLAGSCSGDCSPPTAPTLVSTGATTTSISLSWSGSTDPDSAIAGYYVYRGSANVATVSGTSYTDTGLTPATQYSYSVKAFDPAGNISPASNTVTTTTTAASTGPSAPTLTSSNVTSTTVSLSWNAVTDSAGVTGYYVYEGSTQIATPTGTTYTVAGLTPSTSYTFSVSAVDASGVVSPPSNVVSVTTTSATTGSVEAEASGNVLTGGAVVQSCSGCSGGQDVGYIGNNSGTLTINFSVATAGAYNVTIAYVNGDSAARTAQITVDSGTPQTVSFAPTSSWSTPNNLTLSAPITLNSGAHSIEFSNPSSWAPDVDKITVTLSGSSGDTTPPTAPTLTAGAVTATTVALTWSGSTDNTSVAGYYVLRGATQVANVTSTSYTDTGLTSATQYTYTVKAYDPAGNVSAASNAVTVTTSSGGASGSCHVSYSLQSSWSTGFDAAINITNSGSTALNGWTLTWTWAGNQALTQVNGASYSQTGQAVTLTSLSWDGSIAAGGTLSGDVSIAASYSGTNTSPSVFFLNGTQCQ